MSASASRNATGALKNRFLGQPGVYAAGAPARRRGRAQLEVRAQAIASPESPAAVPATDVLGDFVKEHGGKRVIRKVCATPWVPALQAEWTCQLGTHRRLFAAGRPRVRSHHSRIRRYSRASGREKSQILIANNGMAAAKCILSMRKWAFLNLGSEKLLHFVAMVRCGHCFAPIENVWHRTSWCRQPTPGGSRRRLRSGPIQGRIRNDPFAYISPSARCHADTDTCPKPQATPEDLNANAEFIRQADEYVEVRHGRAPALP